MKRRSKEFVRLMVDAIRKTRNEESYLVDRMPNRATTAGQRVLKKKHGTPRQFALACINAIGDISPLEAKAAIKKYAHRWRRA